MATLQTFTQELVAHLDRPDVSAQVPTAFARAQALLQRTYLPRFLLRNGVRANLTNNVFVLPNDTLRLRAARLWLPTGLSYALDEVPETRGRIYERHFISLVQANQINPQDMFRYGTLPLVFWREGGHVCMLPFTPPQGSYIEIDYYYNPPVPARPNDTSPWLDNAYDIIFYATSAELRLYLADPDMANLEAQQALLRLKELANMDAAYEDDYSGPIRIGDGGL
ncbi:hypothetical protein D6779_10585 [Candidatus Parcubacteria bacterium]|nr:MAG: hypothetical protein D6779_10585 [Candidatus Parcubacteria bacterium]